MKTSTVAVPLVVLLAAGIWVVSQFDSIAKLERENAVLAKQLAAGPDEASIAAKKPAPKKSPLDRKPIDWSAVAAELRNRRTAGGWGFLSSTARVEKGLRSMTREELIAAFDAIEEGELSRDDRKLLQSRLFPLLTEKDPEYVARQFLHRLLDGWQYSLARALALWAKTDPAKAVAWFDEQVAAGKFDSKGVSENSDLVMTFRGMLVSALLSSDSAAAGRQLAALPEAERMGVIVSFAETAERGPDNGVKEADQAAYANLVRQQLPEAAHLTAITLPVTPSNDGKTISYSVMDGYFSRIDATSAERAACIMRMAGFPCFPRKAGNSSRTSVGDLDAFRDWMGRAAPELVDQATAKALSVISNQYGANYSELAAFALSCHEVGGSDEVLIPMLEADDVSKNIGLARTLAVRLTDEKRRAGFLEKLDQMHPKP